MTLDTFRQSLAERGPPSGLDTALQGLWWAGAGDWDRAHALAQQREGDPRCDLLHAYLHRQEGDAGNAHYWYRRAGRSAGAGSLQEEWDALATEFLARPAGA
ncbi:MAG: hypothetical protein JOZ42_16855 [Acetobacteraceae bacterium]|nr:hypothetical protein [Acetobacteraceae bacterium]